MPGATNYELAEQDYMSGMKYKDIAEKYDVSLNTVKSWKTRYKWSRDNKKGVHTKDKKVRTQNRADTKPIDDGTKETMLNENLTHEQRLFCIYYSKIFNAAQSYQKAYGCTYETAMVNGSNLLRNTKVKEEIQRLNEIKRQQIVANSDDLIELHMRIAFADIGNYVSFGQEEVPVMGPFGPISVKDKDTEEEIGLTKVVNMVKAKDSANVDTQIIQEVKQGKDGFAIKLADKQKSLDWLDKFFLMNPMDKHKIDYDNKKLEFEHKKIEPEQVSSDGIKEFLKAIRPSEEDLKELFADEEVIEDGEETTEE